MDKLTYQFFVSMDVKEEFENLFNEVYDKEHIPELLNVPGVEWVTRLKLEPGEMMIAGQSKSLNTDGVAKYLAVYGLSDPKAISSKEWDLEIDNFLSNVLFNFYKYTFTRAILGGINYVLKSVFAKRSQTRGAFWVASRLGKYLAILLNVRQSILQHDEYIWGYLRA